MSQRVAIPVGEAFTLEADVAITAGAPVAIVCHPHPAFGGRMDNPLVVALASGLGAMGCSTVRFNFRGIGGSGGAATGGRAEHEDVAACAAWARAQAAPAVALVGYSFGALMAARAIAGGEDAAAFAAVGFPSTLVNDREREDDVARAVGRGRPWLFVSGDADPLSEIDRLRGFVAGQPTARLVVMPGRGHLLAGADADEAVAAVVTFVQSALTRRLR